MAWFAVLGDIEMRVGEERADLGHARQRSVLAALLVDANRVVPVDRLGERVWGEEPPARFRGTLYSYLSRLRSVLGGADASAAAARIDKEPGGYRLAVDAAAVDLNLFRDLVARARAAQDDAIALDLCDRALALWRGEPFAAVDTPWFNALRDTVQRERLSAELDRNDIALRLGEHAQLLAALHDTAREHPLDERLAGQLMLALYRCGRTADALDHYERTRARLADDLGIDPAPPLRHLHQRILTADPSLDPRPPAARTPAAATESPVAEPTSALRTPAAKASAPPVPRQLPAPPAAFTGRLDELAELDRALAECAGSDATGVRAGGRVSDRAVAPAGAQTGGTVVISAIGGTGGIGKSWLALRWAHHNADRFPDGQLYVNLRGFDPSSPPLPPDAAVRQLLEALGVDRDAVPGDPEATIALYRSVVAGKRLLVVLDDARDADQVDPLLPGTSSCTVLVTSRNRLLPLAARHGAGLLHLDVFDEADAHALLLRHLGERRVAAEPEAVAVIVECCAGLPLALGIAAARAVSHPGFPLSVLAGELREATGRLDALDIGGLTANLRGAFAASRRALTEPARQLFGLLGIAPGPDISLDAAASLAGGTVASVRKPLAELEAAHLVDQWSPGRYRMHDLVRLYAAEPGVAPEDRTAPLTRVTDFYLHSAFAANRQLDGPDTPFRPTLAAPAEGCLPREPTDGRAALDWFTAEHACLVAAQRTALAEGRLPVVWQLAWTLISFHLGGHQLRDYEGVWHNALTAADRFVGEAGPRTLATWRLGHARALEGRSAEALEHLDVALALAEESGDTAGQAHISRTIAWVWERKGDCPRALDHAARALALYASVGNTTWEANQLNAVGWLCAQLGRYDEALTHCEQALDLFRGAAHPGAEASTLDSLGYINHHTGRWERAVAYYEEALDLFTSLGDTYDQADTLANLADTQDAMGRADLARATRLRALDLYRAQNREAGVDRMREHLG